MADLIHSQLARQFDYGVALLTEVNNLSLYICFVWAETDFELLPEIVPTDRFDQGQQVHVGELRIDMDISDEMESILVNMQDLDTVVFFCDGAQSIADGMAFLNYHEPIQTHT